MLSVCTWNSNDLPLNEFVFLQELIKRNEAFYFKTKLILINGFRYKRNKKIKDLNHSFVELVVVKTLVFIVPSKVMERMTNTSFLEYRCSSDGKHQACNIHCSVLFHIILNKINIYDYYVNR